MICNDIFKSSSLEPFLDELENLSNKSELYLIDILPKKVFDQHKFEQYEIAYDFINKCKKQNVFFDEENKFIKVLKKIWLYNKTKAFIFECKCENLFTDEQDIKTLDLIKKNENKTKFITDIDELELLTKLGVREKLYSILVFEDMEIICWIGNGLNCSMYFNQTSSIELIKKIATTEGLYLYKH